jgi:pilus assembly protein CpaB
MMKKLRRRLFLLAIIFALLTAGAVYVYLNSLDDRPEIEVKTYEILVATMDIPARTIVTPDMIGVVEVQYEPNDERFYQSVDDIIGKYVVTKIYRDAQFHKDSISENLVSDLSLKISGNMRAVSLMVPGSNGVANLVKPGDRVDVVVFLPGVTENGIVLRPDIVKIIMQNVEVLAINQDLTVEEEEVINEETIPKDSGAAYITTLAIPVHEVEKLILAKDIGMIDLILRPLEGDYIYPSEGIIWQELLVDDFDQLKDMFPNYEVKSIGEVYIDPNEVEYDKYIYYTVEFGDTLKEISMLFYGTEDNYLLLKQVNNIEDENIITSGMGLKIPVINE